MGDIEKEGNGPCTFMTATYPLLWLLCNVLKIEGKQPQLIIPFAEVFKYLEDH